MSQQRQNVNTADVLIVEDIESIRYYQEMLFVKLGFNSVDTACDGQQARELLRSKHYHVVLLDINMPGEDGMSILRWISDNYFTQVIMCTVNSTEQNVKEAVGLGAKGFLAKPILISNFLEQLQRLGFDTTGLQ